MRKMQKEQIQDFITLLREAHKEIENNIKENYEVGASDLLQQSYEGVVELEKLINTVRMNSKYNCNFFEMYREVVSVLFSKLQAGEQIFSDEVSAILDEKLKDIEKNINDSISIHYEIVFLPYKASMWDSLESIYHAAKRDENCDVYVIPIPYYDKSPDGSLTKMHYEGNEFPEDVIITNYNEYLFETRQPDVIFIHNPYDEKNYVTSVHPFFYSKNLRNFTKQLVYVPYFVTPNVLPESLCVTMGSVYADTVVAQSRDVKDNYLLYLEKIYAMHLKDKVVALGSPKLEKASKCVPEDYQLPYKWGTLIEKADGTKKKVVFYNTSLGTILENSENYLIKLKNILSIFENFDDVVLWWRPHPLTEATLTSMRPHLYDKYKEIVQEYKKQGWGIYDETADLYRALAWSDAYYGDRSSVTMLFTAAKKPVMIQSIKKSPLAFETIVEAGGYWWFSAIGFNGLFRVKNGNDVAEFVGVFPDEKDMRRLYMDIVYYDNKLVFVPLAADAIAVYCIDSNEYIKIPIDKVNEQKKRKMEYSSEHKFTFAKRYGSYVYMFPATYPAIIKLDLNNYEIEYLYEPIKNIDECILKDKGIYVRAGIQDDSQVTMWCVAAQTFVQFDMENESMDVGPRLAVLGEYVEAVKDGANYWLIPINQKSKVIKVSGDYRIIECIDIPEGTMNEAASYLKGICFGGELWIFPATAEHVVKICLKDGRVEQVIGFEGNPYELNQISQGDWKFFFAKQQENLIVAFNNLSQELMMYDATNDKFLKKIIYTNDLTDENKTMILDVLKAQCNNLNQESDLYIYEGSRCYLGDYLQSIKKCKEQLCDIIDFASREVMKKTGMPDSNMIGENILDYVKCRL